jgi:hypothetical protein
MFQLLARISQLLARVFQLLAQIVRLLAWINANSCNPTCPIQQLLSPQLGCCYKTSII